MHVRRFGWGMALGLAAAGAAVGASGKNGTAPRWQDMAGRRHALADGESRATVLLFGSTRCPCADGYTSRLLRLAEGFGSRGARFFMVFSAPDVTEEETRRYVDSRRIPFPAVRDGGGELARRFGAVATPTAVLLDAKGKVAYCGRIDDSPEPVAVRREYLREALDAVLGGKRVALKSTLAVGCSLQGKKDAPAPQRPVTLEEGIGIVRFPVTAANEPARRFFRQGLTRWFGFNFPEAERSFREAARRDPNCAMAYWGIALSLGMNYNADFDPARLPEAREAARKAVALAARTTPKEQALIRALALRNDRPGEEQALEPYREAMRQIYGDYRDDPNLGVLYAASIMDVRPWALWTADGKPQPGTEEAVQVLEDVLRRDPDHIGAHHFYIHATEASPDPGRALASARRLANLAPRSGHLVHMPAHTYARVGDWANAAASNGRASGIDQVYFAEAGQTTRYAAYYVHNLDFLIADNLMLGHTGEAIRQARTMAEVTAQLVPEEVPIWCGSASGVLSVFARCGRWDEILRAAAPPEADPFSTAMWRYARGRALLAKGDLRGAEAELRSLEQAAPAAEKAIPPIPAPGFAEALRKAYAISLPVLAGKVALAKDEGDAALSHFRRALAIEDSMPYVEPPTWRYPVREALGGALLKLGRPAEAEAVFREDLRRNRKSGRALFGLALALERQGKADEAAQARARFQEAWKQADIQLVEGDL